MISSLPSTLLAALACFPPLVKAPPQVQHNRQNKEKITPLLTLNISAAFVQRTRHLSTSNYSGASSLHCFPLHHCLCRVCLQGHLAFINCQVEQWFQVDQTNLIFLICVRNTGFNKNLIFETKFSMGTYCRFKLFSRVKYFANS